LKLSAKTTAAGWPTCWSYQASWAYGESEDAALSRVQALALRVIAERLEHGEAGPELLTMSFNAA
jgi:hypothetical protein